MIQYGLFSARFAWLIQKLCPSEISGSVIATVSQKEHEPNPADNLSQALPRCRSPPFNFGLIEFNIEIGGLFMQRINLRDYYPYYIKDVFVDVPDEVAALLHEYKLLEEAYRIRTYRHQAFYFLEDKRDMTADSIESVWEMINQNYCRELIYKGLSELSEKQRSRIYAHYFLGMSKAAIARAEGTDKSRITRSIDAGLRRLKKFF